MAAIYEASSCCVPPSWEEQKKEVKASLESVERRLRLHEARFVDEIHSQQREVMWC